MNSEKRLQKLNNAAKKYADDSSPVFINGILASIVKEKNLNES